MPVLQTERKCGVMARYIDADLYEFPGDLMHIPTADVVEVKHGEWIEDAYYDNPCVCSYCGVEAPYFNKFEETFDYDWEENLVSTGHKTIKEYIRTQYCHRCGAKMDGGNAE